MRDIFVVLGLASVLGSCVSASEVQIKQDNEDDATCRSYGINPRSSSYARCRIALKRDHDTDFQVLQAGPLFVGGGFCHTASAGWQCN